ncbi:hypothetical protein KUCAC02_011875 [Chaenocephalus aceratus]|uniref:Uncharacterized protein n=1 Tax=Chaenocephalus aceratus TaxID=36190 RepID=A0ACB9X8U4_CHAAC|nr:hypothetical protein KUCAC02_011875 [Chaenocephalus aceratus]
MDSTALLKLLLQLVLMGTVCGIPVCTHPCERTSVYSELSFKHISELQDSSVAPWKMSIDTASDRNPEHILFAECKECTLKNMVAKPIMLQSSTFFCNTDMDNFIQQVARKTSKEIFLLPGQQLFLSRRPFVLYDL